MSTEATARVYGAGCSERFRVIAHISIGVKNIDRIKHFYDAALRPLGYKCPRGARTSVGYGFGVDSVFFWILSAEHPLCSAERRCRRRLSHCGAYFGGQDNFAPGLRPRYAADYYAAFIIDPDGTGSRRIVDRAKGDGWRIPTITVESEDYVCLVALAVIIHAGTTGRLIIALIPGRRRHRIWTGSTASRSLGQRVYKVSSAHLPSRRAS